MQSSHTGALREILVIPAIIADQFLL